MGIPDDDPEGAERLQRMEEKFTTFPKERWKIVVWWTICALGIMCWAIYDWNLL